jgi:hypothetical protein
MLKKAFLLAQHDDWTRHLTDLNAQLGSAAHKDRPAKLERVGKAAVWLAHYARLLRDGHGVHVKG